MKIKSKLSESTIETLQEYGFDSLKDYLIDLSEQYNVLFSVVRELYSVLGESELFDGLVSAAQDAERMMWYEHIQQQQKCISNS